MATRKTSTPRKKSGIPKASQVKSTKAKRASSVGKSRRKTPKRPDADPTKIFADTLVHLKEDNRLRHIPGEIPENEIADTPSPRQRGHRKVTHAVDLLSNDYLGLGAEAEKYMEEFRERFPDASFSSSASRLLSRKNTYHNRLEAYLEELYGRPALLFNSGYHANVGIIQALAVPGTMFIADKLVHASAIDGMRLSGADFKRFPHNSVNKLRRILNENYDAYDRFVVIIESIYSMDGDLAPLREIAGLKRTYPKMMLYVDEAHAFGVRGERGLGLAEECGLINEIDILVGTLGKAAASAGAFAIVSPVMKNFLINTARSFIFSTAMSPAQAAWSILMIEKLVGMHDRRRHLAELSKEFISQLESRNNIETPAASQIVPMIIGDAGEAMNMADYLRENGFDTLAIRKPTVAAGSERLRFSLNALLSVKDITRLVGLIGKYH